MIEVLLGFWQFHLVFGVGLCLARWIKDPLPYGYRLAAGFGLGMSAFSIGFLLLGGVGGLRPHLLISISLVLTLPALWAIRSEAGRILRSIGCAARSSPFAFGLTIGLLFFYFLGACVPEREEDAIWYHLGVPIHYLHHDGFIREVPYNLPSHYPMYSQLHYLLSLSVGNDSTAKVFAFCQFMPILLLIYTTLRRLGRPEGAVLGCVLFLCCVHFRLPVMANDQRAVCLFAFLSVALLWEALNGASIRTFALGAFFCGMAMGTKMNSLLFCYLAQVLLIASWAIFTRPGWRRPLCLLFLHSAISWLTLGPWLIKSFLITGNPFYPMLSEVFDCHPRFRGAMETTANLHGIAFLKAGTPAEAWGMARHNFATLFAETDLLFSLGIVSLVLLPLLRFRPHNWMWTSSVFAYLLLTQVWGGATGRLFGVNAALLAVLIASTLSELKALIDREGSRFAGAIFPLTAVLFVASFLFVRLPLLQSPGVQGFGGVALDEPARRDWLVERGVRTADSLEMEEWMNSTVPPDREVYVAPLGYLSSLNRRFVASDKYFGEQFFDWVEDGIADVRLDELGVAWLLIDSIQSHRASEPLLDEYLARSWIPAKTIGSQALFRRKGTPTKE